MALLSDEELAIYYKTWEEIRFKYKLGIIDCEKVELVLFTIIITVSIIEIYELHTREHRYFSPRKFFGQHYVEDRPIKNEH